MSSSQSEIHGILSFPWYLYEGWISISELPKTLIPELVGISFSKKGDVLGQGSIASTRC